MFGGLNRLSFFPHVVSSSQVLPHSVFLHPAVHVCIVFDKLIKEPSKELEVNRDGPTVGGGERE